MMSELGKRMKDMYDNCTSDTANGSITISSNNEWTTANIGTACDEVTICTPFLVPNNNKKGDDDMRFLYEVILVNPKNDEFFVDKFVAKTETSALMQAYDEYAKALGKVDFDDLKTSCRVLMEWKKKECLKKAIETIKEAVE